ncbi:MULTISPECIES: response regulator [Cohaesibacter]|uniref:response regulator n=1 Tax=Cohaesibacter TaxID=655352 RepID=UPI000DEBF5D4|nr:MULTISPECIES: response regulator [Cohaesibacter]TLP46998.1 response regulator [Cohaesibacter sp. CAU 1516]
MTTRILCVEDEELLLDDIVEELQDEGYETLKAHNGKEAIEILKHETVDLILCDIMMPLIDGLTTLKLVRERLPQHNEVPFIFLTAKATREDILAGKRLGVDDYLTKPIDYDLLHATISTRINQVHRFRDTNEERLKRIYNALKEKQSDNAPLSVSLIAKSHSYVAPIEQGLKEVGCMVEFIQEEHLSKRKDAVEENDLCFLLYSKVVHFYLSGLINTKKTHGRGKMVLLCNDKVDENLKKALVDLGIGRTIDYPFPPVKIFKIIMAAMQNK